MSETASAIIRWEQRPAPLPPVAVAARGRARPTLAASASERLRGGAALKAAGNESWLLVLGPEVELPWCDGALYLGSDGGVLLPTTLRCWPAPDLVLRAIHARTRRPELVVAVLPETVLLVRRPERAADLALLAALVSGG